MIPTNVKLTIYLIYCRPLQIHFHVVCLHDGNTSLVCLMGYVFISSIHRAHVCSKRSFSSHSSQQMRVISRCVFSFWTSLILQQASSVRLELFVPIKGSSWPVNIKFACCFVLVRLDMSVMDGCYGGTMQSAKRFLLLALI